MFITSTNYKAAGLNFCANHTGKMSGIISLSTSPLDNQHCKARAKVAGSVCSHCYACRQLKRYKTQSESLRQNSETLSKLIPLKSLPVLSSSLGRFESFGDLFSSTQVQNYFNLCRVNPGVNFALWTKNPGYISQALRMGAVKPANLQIVYSSQKLDKISKAPFDFIDKVFTVWTPAGAAANNITINCGGRNCLGCQSCYHNNGVTYINELLK